uniref:Ovule protein n=1 Tax=Steinernema glaseri TaxID=37863 RepID=A0A1I7Z9E8_9BILA
MWVCGFYNTCEVDDNRETPGVCQCFFFSGYSGICLRFLVPDFVESGAVVINVNRYRHLLNLHPLPLHSGYYFNYFYVPSLFWLLMCCKLI